VYADLLAGHRTVSALGIFLTFRARQIANRRQIRKFAELRSERGRAGVLYGAATGVLWSLTVGPLWLLSFSLVMDQDVMWYQSLAYGMAIAFPTACLFGVWLGRSTSLAAARRDIFHQQENWPLDFVTAPAVWVPVFIFIALWAIIGLVGFFQSSVDWT